MKITLRMFLICIRSVQSNLFTALLIGACIYTLPTAYAQSINDSLIDLNLGQWDKHQSTIINGVGVRSLEIISSHCIAEPNTELTAKSYADKMMSGLDAEAQCTFSDLTRNKSNVSFDMQCINNKSDLILSLNINHRFSPTKISMKAQGTIEADGTSQPVQVTASSKLIGPCNAASPGYENLRLIGGEQPFALKDVLTSKSNTALTNKTIKNAIKPSQLNAYLKSRKSGKPLVVHYTSTDPNCTHCIKDNKSIINAQNSLNEKFDFVQVVFNPWKSFTKKYRRLGGLPTTEIFDGIVPESTIKGHQVDMPQKIVETHKKTQVLLNSNYENVAVLNITSNDLKEAVNQDRNGKTLLVHLTSMNVEACPFCVKNNRFFRAAAREYSEHYNFTEIEYKQLSDLKADKALLAYLKEKKLPVGGLPVVLFFGEKGQVKQRPGIWHTILNDFKAVTKKGN